MTDLSLFWDESGEAGTITPEILRKLVEGLR